MLTLRHLDQPELHDCGPVMLPAGVSHLFPPEYLLGPRMRYLFGTGPSRKA
jgi:hypothetical protein